MGSLELDQSVGRCPCNPCDCPGRERVLPGILPGADGLLEQFDWGRGNASRDQADIVRRSDFGLL